MKNLNNTLIILVAILLITFTKANSQISKVEIRATGLTCSMCSNAINKQLKSLPQVESVDTDLNNNTFTVTLKKGNTSTPIVFKDKVEKAGFFIGSIIVFIKSEDLKNKNYILVNDSKAIGSEAKIQILDYGYVTDKEFKKLSKSFKNIATYDSNNEDDFHFKFVK